MNLMKLHFFSDELHTFTDIIVCLPKNRKTPLDEKIYTNREIFPVLYLLHGALDCGESWLYHTDLEDLVDSHRIAVVLPSAGNSFYLDEPQGISWFTYITRELMGYLPTILPLSVEKEKTFIGGLSMGGYGALFAVLKEPALFGKAFSLSGAVDIRRTASFVSSCGASLPSHMRRRKELPNSEYDLFRLAGEGKPGELPPLLLACGCQDFLYGDNRNFCKKLDECGVSYAWKEAPGDHEWKFWRWGLQEAMKFLCGK